MNSQNDRDPALQLFLGVDGGGTKTAAWLGAIDTGMECTADGVRIIGRGLAGPGNPRSLGFEPAMRNVQEAIDAAFAAAAMVPAPVNAACLCLAGAGRADEQASIVRWAYGRRLAQTVHTVSDVEAVAAAQPPLPSDCASVALIAGTGSIAWGRHPDGNSQRCGGWGYLLGDEGSGYALGLELLRLACRTADGREGEIAVLDAVLQATRCANPQQLVEWTYGAQTSRARISHLAKLLFELQPPSEQAMQLIARGAQQLAEQVATVTRSLNAARYSLAMAGGLLVKQSSYRDRVRLELVRLGWEPMHVELIEHPVLGAVRLAAEK